MHFSESAPQITPGTGLKTKAPRKKIFFVGLCNSSIERVKEFKYLRTVLTDQNSIQEEIKSRLKVSNACYHSVQNLLSSSLLSKNLKNKIYRTVILPFLYGCETWSLTLREERRLRVLRRVFGSKRDEVTVMEKVT
jgi:hypothetical protein